VAQAPVELDQRRVVAVPDVASDEPDRHPGQQLDDLTHLTVSARQPVRTLRVAEVALLQR
jgi:hypothetical protein